MAEATLIAIVVAAPLAIGGVHAPVRAALQVATAIALALVLGDRRARRGRLAITVPTVALGCALAATLAQLVPMPRGLLRTLSPRTAEALSATIGDAGWRPATLDVSATIGEAGKLALYAAFFVAATLYASRIHRRRRLLLAVIGVAVAGTIVGFLQAIAGTTQIWFAYAPDAQILNEILVRGTFVNPNHFGALLALAAPLALVWGLREPDRRWLAFGAVVILNVGIVLSLSRGAMVAGLASQAIAIAVTRSQALVHNRRRGRGVWLIGIAVVLGLAAVAVMLVRARLERTHPGIGPLADTSGKTYVWSHALEVAWNHPWTGVGRGAFEQAFTRFTTLGGQVRHQFAENGYIQAMADWGVPTTLLLALLAVLGARLCVERLGREPMAVGAFAALAGLAIHELADFAIELPGVALPALAVLATLFGARTSEPLRAQRHVALTWPWMFAPVVPLALGALFFVLPSANADLNRLRRLAADPDLTADAFLAEADRARARHPADYTIAAAVASHLATLRHPATLRWLNDVIFLNPSHQGAHLLAAEVLASAGRRDQALLEFREAARVAAPNPGPIWDRAGRRFPKIEDLLRATPEGVNGHLYLVEWLWTQQRWPDAAAVLARAREQAPGDLRILRLQVAVALRGGSPQAAEFARDLLERAPDEDGRLLLAEAELAQGHLAEACKHLDLLTSRTARRLDLELRAADAMTATGLFDAARKRLQVLDWPVQRLERARVHDARAALERRVGNDHQAQWEIQQATRLRGL